MDNKPIVTPEMLAEWRTWAAELEQEVQELESELLPKKNLLERLRAMIENGTHFVVGEQQDSTQ